MTSREKINKSQRRCILVLCCEVADEMHYCFVAEARNTKSQEVCDMEDSTMWRTKRVTNVSSVDCRGGTRARLQRGDSCAKRAERSFKKSTTCSTSGCRHFPNAPNPSAHERTFSFVDKVSFV